MKKSCIAAIIALGIGSYAGAVFAETDADVFVDVGGSLKVNIVSDADENQLYTIYVLEKDTVLSDKTGTENMDGIIRLEQAELVPDTAKRYNTVSLSADISSLAAGEVCKVVIGGGELDGMTVMTVRPAQAAEEQATAAIKSADAASIGSVLTRYQDSVWVLDFDNKAYTLYRSEVNENLVKMIKEENADSEDIVKCYSNACALAQLAHCDKAEIYNILLKNEYNFGITLTAEVRGERKSISEAFSNLRPDKKNNPLNTVSDLSGMLRKSEAIGLLNDATRENLLDVLTEYNDVFGLNFSGDYTKVDSYEVVKKMVSDGNTYKTSADVQNAFNNAVASLIGSTGSPGVPGGGFGGGGSGSGSGRGSGGGFSAPVTGGVTSDIVESVDSKQRFIDIDDASWAKPYIIYMQDRGIMAGDGDGRVRPNDAVRREEFLKILIEAMKLTEDKNDVSLTFGDVEENEWYTKYILTAVRLGIVNGIDENTFGTGRQITRQDAAVMIYRAVETEKKILKEICSEQSFSDGSNIADYAVNPIKTMQKADIISGYDSGEFLPQNPVTRAESAKLIYSVLKNTEEL